MKSKLLYILISLCVVFTSCEEYLDVTPQTQVPAEDFFTQENGYEDALVGCYMKMTSSNLYGKFLTMSGIDYMAQYFNNMQQGSVEEALKNYNFNHEKAQLQFKSLYNELYNVILQANDIIINIDTEEAKNIVKSENKRNLIKGEALAFRAFCHFDLLRVFGQMPKDATIKVSLPYSEITGTEDRPLLTYEKYVEKLHFDMTTALQLLAKDPVKEFPLSYLNAPTDAMFEQNADLSDNFFLYRRFRMNYYAVTALLARFYHYTGDTQNAYTKAMEVISATGSDGVKTVTLAGDSDLSKGFFTLPSETLFALSYSELESMTIELNNLFQNGLITGDPMRITEERKNELFQGRNTGSNNRYNLLWGKYVNSAGSQVPYLKKYFQNEVAATDDSKLINRWQIPLLRLSEMYLIAMECSISLDEINTMFYTYMVARNEQPAEFVSLEEAKEEVINEFRREFIAEGQMFFAYKRMGSSSMKWNVAQVKEENYVVPVPASEKR